MHRFRNGQVVFLELSEAMAMLPFARHNKDVTGSGAQTERRGGSGPVRRLLSGKAAPADLLLNP
jgi:hypothetical protein